MADGGGGQEISGGRSVVAQEHRDRGALPKSVAAEEEGHRPHCGGELGRWMVRRLQRTIGQGQRSVGAAVECRIIQRGIAQY